MAERSEPEFLAVVADRLTLPPDLAQEVVDELAAHIADSVAALEAEGLDSDRARREALARLGNPESLAEDIVRAHRSRRRLLAGIGGGAYAAGEAWITGIIFGWAFVTIATIVVIVAGSLLARALGLQVSFMIDDQGANTALFGVGSWIAAFLTARALARTSADRSFRPIRQPAPWWAVIGSALLTVWVMFGLVMPLNAPAVLVELAIPAAFAAGAYLGIERRGPRIRMRLVAASLLVVMLPVFALGAMSATLSEASLSATGPLPGGIPDLRYDRVGPPGPDDIHGADGYSGSGDGSIRTDGGPAALIDAGRWSALRFEAWASQSSEHGIPSLYAADLGPFAVASAVREGDRYVGMLPLSRYRDVGHWTLFFTGRGVDGRRYRLGGGAGGQTSFRGTIWEWLTAPSAGAGKPQ